MKNVNSFMRACIPYFFGCTTEFFSFQNNSKDLDPSCKTDLDPCDCSGRVKIDIIAKFNRTDLVIGSHSRGTNTLSYSRINTVILNILLRILLCSSSSLG